jgi:hypothetical protein
MELCSASDPELGGHRARDRLAHISSVPGRGVATSTLSGARVRKTRAAPAMVASTGRGTLKRVARWTVPGGLRTTGGLIGPLSGSTDPAVRSSLSTYFSAGRRVRSTGRSDLSAPVASAELAGGPALRSPSTVRRLVGGVECNSRKGPSPQPSRPCGGPLREGSLKPGGRPKVIPVASSCGSSDRRAEKRFS